MEKEKDPETRFEKGVRDGREMYVHHILNALYKMDLEILKDWIVKKWPHGIGLYE